MNRSRVLELLAQGQWPRYPSAVDAETDKRALHDETLLTEALKEKR